MPMEDITPLGKSLLAFRKYGSLPRYFFKSPNDRSASIYKPVKRVWNSNVGAEVLHKLLGPAKIMPRHPGEQVMNSLKLQSSMEKVKPWGAFDIHSSS